MPRGETARSKHRAQCDPLLAEVVHGVASPTGIDGLYMVQAVEWFAALKEIRLI